MTGLVTQQVPASLQLEVAEYLGAVDGRISFRTIGIGSQATCYSVVTANSTANDEPVLKLFHEDVRYGTTTYCAQEFDALRSFHAASRGYAKFSCPEPLALFERERAYLMAHVHGQQLSSLLDHGQVTQSVARSVQSGLVEALHVFYEATDLYYGDFHPDNIFLQNQVIGPSLSLIDPCMANPRIYYAPDDWPRHASLSVDMGYWVFVECARHWRALIVRPHQAIRRLRFTRGLVKTAIELHPSSGLRDGITQIVQWHAQRFRDKPTVRLSLVGDFAEQLARWVCRP
jgi:hypothetical protein